MGGIGRGAHKCVWRTVVRCIESVQTGYGDVQEGCVEGCMRDKSTNRGSHRDAWRVEWRVYRGAQTCLEESVEW